MASFRHFSVSKAQDRHLEVSVEAHSAENDNASTCIPPLAATNGVAASTPPPPPPPPHRLSPFPSPPPPPPQLWLKTCSCRQVINPKKVQVIGRWRANNMEIMLAAVKKPPHVIIEAVLAMDERVLGADQVENLLMFLPTKEETDILKSYTGNLDKLGKCEQYFLELMKVPRMDSKLNALLFKIQFKSQLAELQKKLNTINSACDEVTKSIKLKEIMKRIIYLGNTLNQATARGSAVGFKLESILKLRVTRVANDRWTLLHFVCKKIESKEPNLLNFHEDLVSLEAAAEIKVASVKEEMQALTIGLRRAEQELNECINDGPVYYDYRMTLKGFIGPAEDEMTRALNFYYSVGKSADRLALYACENPSFCSSEQAMRSILNFVRLFVKCHKENLEYAELEREESREGDRNGIVLPATKCLSNTTVNMV